MTYLSSLASVVADNYEFIVEGLFGTLFISMLALVFSTAGGLVGCAMKSSEHAPLRWLSTAFVEFIRNTPFLVQLFFIFFALPFAGLRMSPITTAVVALSLNGAAYMTEIFRGGLKAVPRGLFEAAWALGMSRLQAFLTVILVPAARASFPAYSGQCVLIVLTSSIASSISASELTYNFRIIDSATFKSFEVYGLAASIYLLLSTLMIQSMRWVHRRYFSYPG